MSYPIVAYLIASLVFAALFFVLAARFRTADVSPPEHSGLIALAGGVAWPLVLVGLIQLGGIALLKKRLAAGQRSVAAPGTASVAAPAAPWMYSHA